MVTTAREEAGPELLGIYLNDHLAGATLGVELAHRMARSHTGPGAGSTMERLAAEIAQDRSALQEIMAGLGVPARGYKVCAGWIGEKVGRLKLNGRLGSRSPLSNLETSWRCSGWVWRARPPAGARFGSSRTPIRSSTPPGSTA